MAISNLFNVEWYLRNNPDVAAEVAAGRIDAETHFNLFGQFENRSPSPLFDPAHYLASSPDVADAVARGLTTAYDHFLNFGASEDRSFNTYFDAGFYLQQNPDVADAVAQGLITAAEHFALFGQSEPRAVSPFIDLSAYLTANPDIADAASQGAFSVMDHLLTYGIHEGRDLGNGVSLSQFQNDPVFQQAVSSGGNPFDAMARVTEVAPFLPSFEPPAGWAPPADTPIPLDFVPPAGTQLVIPPSVTVPDDVELPDTFVPPAPSPEPPVPGGGGGGDTPPPPTFTVDVDEHGNLIFKGTASGSVKFVASATGGVFEREGIKAGYTFGGEHAAVLLNIGNDGVVDVTSGSPKVVSLSFKDTLEQVQSDPNYNTVFVGANDESSDTLVVRKGGLNIVLDAGVTLTGGFDIDTIGGSVSFYGGTIAGGAKHTSVAGKQAIYIRSATDISIVGTTFVSAPDDSRDSQARAIEMQAGASGTLDIKDATISGWVTGIYANSGNSLIVERSTFVGNDVGIGTDGPSKLHVKGSNFQDSAAEHIGLTPKKIIADIDISGNTYSEGVAAINNGTDSGFKDINGINVLVGTSGDDDLRGSDGMQTIFGGDGNDYIQGESSSVEGGDIIIGGNGADWLRGGYGAADGVDGDDIIFAGSRTLRDLDTGVYAESIDSKTEGWPKWFHTHTYKGWSNQFADAKDANILEGLGGNDILIASDQKDIFLFKVMPTGENAESLVGRDTIHNFRVGVDKIAVVVDGDTTFVNGGSLSNDTAQNHVNAAEHGWSLVEGARTGDYILSFNAGDTFAGVGDFSIDLVGVQSTGPYSVNDFFLVSGPPSPV